ncbi:hypothetical protein RXV95_01990 [Novosphingobium sp. ZN18A2]|uniref:hypothetical protein n=1 Tax=Novosphingobium sp. ZN18A2 TaxID=3079861 RepID=UPI0030CF8211
MEMTFHPSRPADYGESQHELRALGWAELCARIGAAQDLRDVMRQGDAAVALEGSFHRPAARALARIRTTGGEGFETGFEERESVINPIPSAHGKDGSGTHGGEPGQRPGKG